MTKKLNNTSSDNPCKYVRRIDDNEWEYGYTTPEKGKPNKNVRTGSVETYELACKANQMSLNGLKRERCLCC